MSAEISVSRKRSSKHRHIRRRPIHRAISRGAAVVAVRGWVKRPVDDWCGLGHGILDHHGFLDVAERGVVFEALQDHFCQPAAAAEQRGSRARVDIRNDDLARLELGHR
jgi:hypothetical protein